MAICLPASVSDKTDDHDDKLLVTGKGGGVLALPDRVTDGTARHSHCQSATVTQFGIITVTVALRKPTVASVYRKFRSEPLASPFIIGSLPPGPFENHDHGQPGSAILLSSKSHSDLVLS